MTSARHIQSFNLEDVRQLASDNVRAVADDLLLIDDFSAFDLSGRALHLGFLAYCHCTAGSATFTLNSRTVELQPGCLFIGVGSQVFHKQSVSPDFKARMVLVSHRFMQDSITGLHRLWTYLLHLYEHPVVRLTPDEDSRVTACYDYLEHRLRMTDHHYLRETVTALLRLFYFDVCDLLVRHCSPGATVRTGSVGLFDRFVRLLDANFREERNVAWYSDRLCITPKYLSEVVKAVSGRTAGQWITDFVVTEIKQLLANTTLSVKEIARQLNFTNQSFLGKYFKTATGCSPLAYRRLTATR